LNEFGFKEESDLEIFRESLGMYSNDKEISSIPYYSKYNRARDGELKVGSEMVDVLLANKENPFQQISLNQFYKDELQKKNLNDDAPFVIIAGSIT